MRRRRASNSARSRLEAPLRRISRGSSVVERVIGNDEVESSILSRGTSGRESKLALHLQPISYCVRCGRAMAKSNLWIAIAAIGTLLGGLAAVGALVLQQSNRPEPGSPHTESAGPQVPEASSTSAPPRQSPRTVTPSVLRSFPNSAPSGNFCALLSEAVEMAPSNFEQWKTGAPQLQRDGSTFWPSTRLLPGAHDCAISRLPNYSEQAYACFWNMESEDDALLARADLIRTIRSCPGVTRGINGHPSVGRVQLMARTLTSQPDVIVLDVVDTTNLNADFQAQATDATQ